MNNKKQLILHSIIWLAIILFFVLLTSDSGRIKYESIVLFVYFGIINIAIFYINYLFILPGYLIKQHYLRFTFFVISLVILSALIKYGLAYYFKEIILEAGPSNGIRRTFSGYFTMAAFSSIFFIFLSTAFRFSIDWFLNEKLKKNLENEKLTSELAFLKSQINPHFLLNSLNNIYSLAYQRSEKTPEAVLKLSEIMRYMLYESNEANVDLEKEIRYLENYIELQKIRFKDSVYVSLDVSPSVSDLRIAPLILIPFVENAFKHGTLNDEKNPIKISIRVDQHRLMFAVINKKSLQNKDETGGIGFHNVKRRLDLLYPGKYKLDIDDSRFTYSCELSLDL